MRDRLRILQWLLVPMCLFIVVELAVRQRVQTHWGWYRQIPELDGTAVDVMFIGSSRVGASIDPVAWSTATGLASPAGVLNMGRGYSVLMQHYLGLRNLLRERPNALKASVIFLEAPGGVPDPATPQDSWMFREAPQQLINQLHLSDLPQLMKSRGPARAKTVWDFLTSGSQAWTHRDWIRRLVKRRLEERVEQWLQPKSAAGSDAAEVDLSAAAGVLTDRAGVQRVRESMLAGAERVEPQSCPSFSDTVAARIHELVRDGGGRLVLFDIPLSSVAQEQFQKSLKPAGRQRFLNEIEQSGVPVLKTGFRSTDEDFPDLSHLRKSRQAEFTRSLAKAWADFNDSNLASD